MFKRLKKTKKQVQHTPSGTEEKDKRCVVETPLNVGIGLYLHQKTRSKELIEMFSELNLSISYHKVKDIKSRLSSAALSEMHKSRNIYVPKCICPDRIPVFFAVNKSDLRINTPDGKTQLHATAMAVYQQKNTESINSTLTIDRHGKQGKKPKSIYDVENWSEPNRKTVGLKSYFSNLPALDINVAKLNDVAWFLNSSLTLHV